MYGFHSNFAEPYITIKYRSVSILVIIHQILAELWAFCNFVFSFCCSCPLINLWRDALISFKLCRTLSQRKMQVKFNIGNHPPNVGWVMALLQLSFCWCVDIGFQSITFAGMHWFYWKFAEGYNRKIQVKFDKLIICKIVAELWPFFDLVFVGVLILVSDQ